MAGGWLVAGCWLLLTGCWLLVAGCWLLLAGCWLLVAAYCLLIAGLVPEARQFVSHGALPQMFTRELYLPSE